MNVGNKSKWLSLAAAACLGVSALAAETAMVQLPGGTRFKLELAHHLTSGRTPTGDPIYFRVTDDVVAKGQTLIRKGTVVEGRMQAIGDRGMNATSGSMNFGVRHVPAVDGQNVRVLATVSREGRDRDGALLGWVFMWGVFGLMTKGVDAYAMRGATLEAEVLTDKLVSPTAAPPMAMPEIPAAAPIQVDAFRIGNQKAKQAVVSLERVSKLGNLSFDLPGLTNIDSAQLVSVNDAALPETIGAVATVKSSLEFDTWDIVKYCDDGSNTLRFRIRQSGGSWLEANLILPVKLERKKPSP